jgi:hypothetical protein
MGTSYQRLRERVDAYEVETGALREGIAKALTDGSLSPSAAGAELIAQAIRSGDSAYSKAVAKVGHKLPAIGGENMGERESVKKARAGDDIPADNHDLTARIRKAAAKRKKEEG